MNRQMTAIIEREGDSYVALCPELDIASQGESVSEARANLKEALELSFEAASAGEIQRRLHEVQPFTDAAWRCERESI
ncbi:MAG: type II toxin-antitoxin system HicB family antitoxin [Chloroflexota bacterium]|nr:type II toxin-antitoxin system HicB family antitoxin [Chloroflexota bacterium]MDE2941731.1 type II toxin-antitoxin system HicB family antitoxin [Chloroflexota bacterium]MDE3268457.1 type II toxin-antitoxin system HicB family antitoxin [Chloroflexota bacterium]